MDVILSPNISDPDSLYDELLLAHQHLSKAESDAFNARLILVLANHIGSLDVFRAALNAASSSDSNSTKNIEDH